MGNFQAASLEDSMTSFEKWIAQTKMLASNSCIVASTVNMSRQYPRWPTFGKLRLSAGHQLYRQNS
jgi:hypothetical protein